MKRLVMFLTFVASWLVMGPSSAQSCLGPGWYEEHDARLIYVGTWTVVESSSAYGGSARYTSNTASNLIFAICPDVSAVVLYRFLSSSSSTGQFDMTIQSGALTTGGLVFQAVAGIGLTAGQFRQAVTVPVTPGYVSTVQYRKLGGPPIAGTPDATFIWVEAIELKAAQPTAGAIVVNMPTHTPTPTATATHTPTLTPTNTPGPSPTPTATATRTPNYVYQATVQVDATQSVDVALRYEVSAGDLFVGAGIFLSFGLALISMFLGFRRKA